MTLNEPVRHHYVPQFLLRRFADARQQLLVHRIAESRSFPAAVLNTGQVKDGHTLYLPQGRNRTFLESAMSKIEAVSAASIEDIIQSNGTDVTDEQKQEITWLAGLQILRNRFTLGYVAHEAQREYPTDATKKVIQTGLLSAALLSYLEAWGHRDDPYAKPKERWNPYAGSLLEFRWDIARYRSPSLVVSDAFIAQSGIRKELRGRYAPVERRWANHGFIVPLHECERVTIPLTPTIGLYLHRFPNRRRIKADDFNRHTVYSSRDFVAHCPDWETANPRLHEAVAENLALQRMLRQAMPASF